MYGAAFTVRRLAPPTPMISSTMNEDNCRTCRVALPLGRCIDVKHEVSLDLNTIRGDFTLRKDDVGFDPVAKHRIGCGRGYI
jgi:hypothetical protein